MVDKDMLIGDLIRQDERAVQVLAQVGMNCIGCASAEGETIEEAALEHGIDPVLLVRRLNLHLYQKI